MLSQFCLTLHSNFHIFVGNNNFSSKFPKTPKPHVARSDLEAQPGNYAINTEEQSFLFAGRISQNTQDKK